MTQQAKWPPDWPERVSSEPFYRWLDECGKLYTEEDKKLIETLCADARQSGLPPDLSTEKCRHLGKFCDIKKALEMMTGKRVKEKLIYSFTLGEVIEV